MHNMYLQAENLMRPSLQNLSETATLTEVHLVCIVVGFFISLQFFPPSIMEHCSYTAFNTIAKDKEATKHSFQNFGGICNFCGKNCGRTPKDVLQINRDKNNGIVGRSHDKE